MCRVCTCARAVVLLSPPLSLPRLRIYLKSFFMNYFQDLSTMASDPGHLYYCYNCERTVELASPGTLICSNCNSDFIEEHSGGGLATEDESSPSDLGYGEADYLGPGFGQLLEDMSSFLAHMQVSPVTAHGFELNNEEPSHILRLGTDARALNPILLLQGRIQNLLNLRGREYVIDNGGPLRVPGTIGDYFVGPGIEHLIQQLAEDDPNKYGTPPAAKSAVDALPTISISEEHLCTDAARCAVCKDQFELRTEVKQLPCNHIYHPDCIFPWLEQHNSCPICRYELPTDDPDYEQARAQRRRAGEYSGTHGGEGSHDGLTFQSGQPIVTRFSTESDSGLQQQDVLSSVPHVGLTEGNIDSGSDERANTGVRFSLLAPLLRGVPSSTQSLSSENPSHRSSLIAVVDGTERDAIRANVVQGLRAFTESNVDNVISETRQEDLE